MHGLSLMDTALGCSRSLVKVARSETIAVAHTHTNQPSELSGEVLPSRDSLPGLTGYIPPPPPPTTTSERERERLHDLL